MKYGSRLTKHAAFLLILLPLALLFYQNAWAYPLPLSDTGQTECYDLSYKITCPASGEAFYGQDGSYIINPPSYTKLDANGNDLPVSATSWVMVRDNVTGLIWEVKTDDGSVHDKHNRYSWQDAMDLFIPNVNGANFGDYSDWRMPSPKELASIVNLSVSSAVDTTFFPNTFSGAYWSTTFNPAGTYLDKAWYVYFDYGRVGYTYKDSKSYARCVRGGPSDALNSLIINNDGTVTDNSTGLMWQQQQKIFQDAHTWENALSYCQNLTLSGHDNWRLPNCKELQSLVDYGTYGKATIGGVFPTPNVQDFSSSTIPSDYNPISAFFVPLFLGSVSSNSKTFYAGNNSARCVRGGQARLSGHLVISLPAQGTTWTPGNSMPIVWDSQGIEGNVKISISRQGGKGETFEIISESTANDGSYNWNVTGTASVNCILKIEPLTDTSKLTTQGFFSICEIPTATTNTATSVSSTKGTLNGTVNPNGGSTTAVFEWGTDTNYGNEITTSQSPISGTTAQAVTADISNLNFVTIYHFRLKVANIEGTANGEDVTFTTSALAPTAATSAATSATSSSTTLNGTVNPNGASTTVTFEYGTTTSYGSTVTASQSPLNGISIQSVISELTNLTPGTAYHFCVKANNSEGTVYGEDATFTTSAAAPAATTNAATSVTYSSVTLNGTVNPNGGSTAISFEYGTTTSYGSVVTPSQSPLTGTISQSVSAGIIGLNASATYYYRVKGGQRCRHNLRQRPILYNLFRSPNGYHIWFICSEFRLGYA